MTGSERPSLEPVPTPIPPMPYPATPPMPYPASAVPYSTPPFPYGPAPAAGKPPLSVWVWVLAGVSALLLVSAGGLGFLYVDSRASNDKQIADRTARIEELTATVSELERTGGDLDREADDITADLDASETELDGLSPCPDALNALMLTDPDSSAFEDAVLAMVDACHADF